MQHFFTKIENWKILDKNIANQISKILRWKPWDKICILDWNWKKEICEILNIEKKFIEVKILEEKIFDKEKFFKMRKKINLFFVLPKSKEKFEFILQKWTELWINEFNPITSDFCNAKYSNKIERNNLIIQEAAEQSERIFLPELKDFKKIWEIFSEKNKENYPLNPPKIGGNNLEKKFYFFDSRLFKEWQENKSQFDLIKNSSYWNEVNLIIWPEWGFSESEAELARENNCEFLTLWENILRLETAIICAISRVN